MTYHYIYVTNLSEETTKQHLMEYFSTFGEVKDAKLGLLPNLRCKGYAKLTVANKETFQKILDGEHTVLTRKLIVEEFIHGEYLKLIKDKMITQRRICVFGIPKFLCNLELVEIFQNAFGEVENGYIRQNHKIKTFNHGFITFKDKESRRKAARMGIYRYEYGESKFIIHFEIKKFIERASGPLAPFHPDRDKNYVTEFQKNYEKIFMNSDEQQNIQNTNTNIKQELISKEPSYVELPEDIVAARSPDDKKKILFPSKTKFILNFIPTSIFEKYLSKILQENEHIENIKMDQLRLLELFALSDIPTTKEEPSRLQMVAQNSRKGIINRNHTKRNIVLKYKKKKKYIKESILTALQTQASQSSVISEEMDPMMNFWVNMFENQKLDYEKKLAESKKMNKTKKMTEFNNYHVKNDTKVVENSDQKDQLNDTENN